MLERRNGFILLPVLLVTMFLWVMVYLLAYVVEEEMSYQHAYQRYRRYWRMGLDLFQQVEANIATLPSGTHYFPSLTLYPCGQKISPEFIAYRDPSGQVDFAKLSFQTMDGPWAIKRIYLRPPGTKEHPAYVRAKTTGLGRVEEPMASLPLKEYLKTPFYLPPAHSSSWAEGLLNTLYVDQKFYLKIPPDLTIPGDGVIFSDSIRIGDNTRFTGRVWFLSRYNLSLGRNVVLDNAFLFSESGISIGSGSSVCGIIVSRENRIDLAVGAKHTGNIKVLDTFVSSLY